MTALRSPAAYHGQKRGICAKAQKCTCLILPTRDFRIRYSQVLRRVFRQSQPISLGQMRRSITNKAVSLFLLETTKRSQPPLHAYLKTRLFERDWSKERITYSPKSSRGNRTSLPYCPFSSRFARNHVTKRPIPSSSD